MVRATGTLSRKPGFAAASRRSVLMSLVMRLGWPGFRPSLLPFWNLFWGVRISHDLSEFPTDDCSQQRENGEISTTPASDPLTHVRRNDIGCALYSSFSSARDSLRLLGTERTGLPASSLLDHRYHLTLIGYVTVDGESLWPAATSSSAGAAGMPHGCLPAPPTRPP
jgi:hypothetical protein